MTQKISKKLFIDSIEEIREKLKVNRDLNGYMKVVSTLFFPDNNDSEIFKRVVELTLSTYRGHEMPAVFIWEDNLRKVKDNYEPPRKNLGVLRVLAVSYLTQNTNLNQY